MKAVAKSEPRIRDDPKPMDRLVWQRIRGLVEREACHSDWACALYSLHRMGRINNDQREAGDLYARLIKDFRKLWEDKMGSIEVYRGASRTDDREDREPEKRSRATRDVEFAMGHVVADGLVEESEFEIKRAQRIGKRYKEAREIASPAKTILEDLLMDDIWPIGEKGQREIGFALTRLSHFFATGTKRKHRK
jgi:hypothetical protein